ncbi:MAG: 1-deoxy-D-xylulose-5-phosphate synthase, partial [Oscillospiraceae bacterium]|nr:1-deoxy-D-xylulose-5-phosphate synthase [Oscillospiraceae bacterium]
LEKMLYVSVHQIKGPVAIRYPRGGEGAYQESWDGEPATLLREGADVTLAGYGTQVNALLEAAALLEEDHISAEVVKLNTLTPTPAGELFFSSVDKTQALWFYEEAMEQNCVGRRLAAELAVGGVHARYIALRNLGSRVPPQGTVDQLRRMNNLDAESIARQVKEVTALEKAAGRSSG